MPNLDKLNQALIEFYDKMSSWEQSVVRETGYTLAQIHTIEVLGTHGPLRMKELAQKLGITTGTLTVQIEKLVQAEIIERCTLAHDRRVIVVKLTAEGQSIHETHNQLHLELTKELTQSFDTGQENVLLDCLSRMNKEF